MAFRAMVPFEALVRLVLIGETGGGFHLHELPSVVTWKQSVIVWCAETGVAVPKIIDFAGSEHFHVDFDNERDAMIFLMRWS